jgi:hypothetical protein
MKILCRQEHKGTLITIFTNIFTASWDRDIILLWHNKSDWMLPDNFTRDPG